MEPDELSALVAADQAKAQQAAPAPGITFAAPVLPPADDELAHMVAADRVAAQAGDSAPPLTVTHAPAVAQPQGVLSNAAGDSDLAALAKNVGTGAVKGVSDGVGFVGNAGNLADYLLSRADSAVTGTPVDQNMAQLQAARQPSPNDSWLHSMVKALDPRNLLPSGSDVSNKVFQSTGQYVPTTPAGRALQGGVEAAVGAAGPGVAGSQSGMAVPGLLGNVARNAPAVGTSGAFGTAVTNATGDPLIGALSSVVPAVAVRSASALGNGAIGTVDPATAQLAQTARNQFGIPVTAPQISDSLALKFGASVLNKMPLSGAGATSEAQQIAFNRAVGQTFGENADSITPQVMQNARARIGNEFDRVAQNTMIRPDAQFAGDLRQTMGDASRVLPEAEVRPLAAQVQNIADVIRQNNGTIPGASYQALTRTGSPLNRAMNSTDSNVKFYAGQIKDALDDTMRRSATPEDAAALTNAKLQYKNMKTVEDLVEKSPTGNISPALLMNQVRGSYGNMAYNGGGDIGDLARIGQRFLKEPPSSGTAERLGAMGMLSRVGGLAGAAMGANSAYQASPAATIGGLASIPASLLAGRAAGSVLRSNAMADALINRSLGVPVPSNIQELANQLMLPALPQAASVASVPSRGSVP